MKDKIVIGICGMYRSGSTWQYNCIKTILELNGYSVQKGNSGHLINDKIEDLKDCDKDFLLFKTHPYKEEDKKLMNLIFTSDRNLDEVRKSFESLMVNEIPHSIETIKEFYMDFLKWDKYSNYTMNYESLKNDKRKTVIDIIGTLERGNIRFKNRIDVDIILKELDKIIPPTDKYFDYNTYLFKNHINCN